MSGDFFGPDHEGTELARVLASMAGPPAPLILPPDEPVIPGGGHDVWGADFGQVGWHQPGAASPSPTPAGPSAASTGPAEGVRERLEEALDASIDRCARCKVCDTQIGAAMTVLGPLLERAERAEAELEHAKAALAGDHEGIRLWMLDCGELVAKHRARAEAAEAKMARVRELAEQLVTASHPTIGGTFAASIGHKFLAIIGSKEEQS